MFGIVRPCRNRLGEQLRREWMAHLCGMCLSLRDTHGHTARLVTNYDAIVVSALVDAQLPTPSRRRAGPCALRGMRGADVSDGTGAELAATVSLLLAAAKLRDRIADNEQGGRVRERASAGVAKRLVKAGATGAHHIGLDAEAMLEAVAHQPAIERGATTLLDVTAPTEAATEMAFAHTAVVAGRPGNEAPLREAGRLFGRLVHLLDAVADLDDDRRHGAWNAIDALALSQQEVRAYCDDAALGVSLALREVDFCDERLVHVLLGHELNAAVRRTFRAAGQPGSPEPPPLAPPLPPEQQPPPTGTEAPPPKESRGRIAACLASLTACGVCQACNDDSPEDLERKKEGCCSRLSDCCDGCDDCSDCCDCCSCCDCCDCDCC